MNHSYIIAIHLLGSVELFLTPWTAGHQAFLSFTIFWSLLKLKSIEAVMPSNHLILSPPSPPALSLSQHQGLFQWVNSSHQVAKVLELQLQLLHDETNNDKNQALQRFYAHNTVLSMLYVAIYLILTSYRNAYMILILTLQMEKLEWREVRKSACCCYCCC